MPKLDSEWSPGAYRAALLIIGAGGGIALAVFIAVLVKAWCT